MLLNYKIVQDLPGDRTRLPQQLLNEITEFNSILIFKLKSSKKTSFSSVREFTSSKDEIEINQRTFDILELETREKIKVELVKLEKCNFIKIIPTGEFRVTDSRAVLEGFLRKNFTVLCLNEHYKVDLVGGKHVEFKIVEIKPSDACLCVDTDMEVDIEFNSLGQVMVDGAGNIEWSNNKVLIKGDQDAFYQIPLLKDILVYKVTANYDGDCCVFLSNTQDRPSTSDYSAALVDDKEVVVEMIKSIEFPFMYIGVFSFNSKCNYSIRVDADPLIPEAPVPINHSLIDISDYVECSNCKSMVPPQTLPMHLIYCERNNTFCPKCSKVLLKSKIKDHRHCEKCDKVISY